MAPAGVLAKAVAATVPPTQTETLAMAVTTGKGFTVWLKLTCAPVQPFNVGVTFIVPIMAALDALAEVKEGTSPTPLAERPILVLVLIQL